MTRQTPFSEGLPVPVDDGACDHLEGMRLPSVPMPSTEGDVVDLSRLSGVVVVYFYPRIGSPDRPTAAGWGDIPGAKGCTPQACDFRDHYGELKALGATVFGASAQSTDEQKEAAGRLELTFPLLHDEGFALAGALKLPTFEFEGNRLIKRLTLIAVDGTIRKVFYPVFPPDGHAEEVIEWIQSNSR
ncbi:redoxin family protein [Marinobacter nanhaiticus D15-8W]|uniref:Peroxiredoxin n=1 Tax=Marinobacter nanhaiticus D15-8W TaxID=626887 RepID=N6WY28_9GAMM|nr:peroxiredoxin [Marinobacter nanhaiticus]ENO16511.1 peroxiredoxin [Marinobacter nanhaiticus D15-8W]BES72302.1 redoxin family protein [Marinobacter nanhaiticus D15-8W]